MVEWNGINKIYCDITGLQPISRILVRKKIGMEEVSILFHAMENLGEEAKKNLLDISDFCFSPEMIFWNMNDDSVWFVFNPEAEKEDLTEYVQFLLENADNSEPDAVKILYELYRAVREGNLDTETLSDYFKYEEKPDKYDAYDVLSDSDSEEKHVENKLPVFIKEEKKRSIFSRLFSKKTEVPEYEDDPLDLSAYDSLSEAGDRYESGNNEETVLINLEESDKKYWLLSENGEEIELPSEGIYIVGSKKEYVDICISNSTVSKIHAQFFQIGNEMMLCDLDSKNGTFVNDERLFSEKAINIHDEIRFGNALFTLLMK